MKSDQASERRQRLRIAVRFQGNENADLSKALGYRAMDILTNEALADMHGGGAPQRYVFADHGYGVGDRVAEGPAARIGSGFQSLDISRPGFDGNPRNVPGQRLKLRVPGNEIRLGIELDNHPVEARDKNGDESLGGDPAGFLGRLGKPLLAQPVNRRFDIAPDLAEGILAIHHAGAGLLAKILHHRRGDVRHIGLPSSSGRRFRAAGSPPRGSGKLASYEII